MSNYTKEQLYQLFQESSNKRDKKYLLVLAKYQGFFDDNPDICDIYSKLVRKNTLFETIIANDCLHCIPSINFWNQEALYLCYKYSSSEIKKYLFENDKYLRDSLYYCFIESLKHKNIEVLNRITIDLKKRESDHYFQEILLNDHNISDCDSLNYFEFLRENNMELLSNGLKKEGKDIELICKRCFKPNEEIFRSSLLWKKLSIAEIYLKQNKIDKFIYFTTDIDILEFLHNHNVLLLNEYYIGLKDYHVIEFMSQKGFEFNFSHLKQYENKHIIKYICSITQEEFNYAISHFSEDILKELIENFPDMLRPYHLYKVNKRLKLIMVNNGCYVDSKTSYLDEKLYNNLVNKFITYLMYKCKNHNSIKTLLVDEEQFKQKLDFILTIDEGVKMLKGIENNIDHLLV